MRTIALTILAAVGIAGTAVAQENKARPPVFQRMIDCRAIDDSAARLACYDREVAAVDQARASQDLVIMDRAQIRTARRTLFGLPLPSLDIFGSNKNKDGGSAEPEEALKLEGTIKQVSRNANGRWILVLDDGARWVQSDSREMAVDPRQRIRITRIAICPFTLAR
jgi:hypothetical protein